MNTTAVHWSEGAVEVLRRKGVRADTTEQTSYKDGRITVVEGETRFYRFIVWNERDLAQRLADIENHPSYYFEGR